MAENIRVLYLITDLGKGGAERSITDLCTALQKIEGIEAVIGSLMPANDYKEVTRHLDVYQLNYQPNSLLSKSYTAAYHKLIENFKPHIIHSNRFLAEFITLEKLDTDIVYVCHGRDNMIQLKNFNLKTLFSKQLLLNFYEKQLLVHKKYKVVKTHFVANSEHTAAYFKSVLPKKLRDKVIVIENGVLYDKFYNSIEKKINAGKRLKLINVGSFQKKKNQAFIIDIAKELKNRKVSFLINLLGDGTLRKSVEQRVADNGLTDYINFHGNVDNVERWLWESDIYLHTATYEPFGLVLIEAMAAGLPCVILNGKGNRNLVHDYENGFLLNSQDPELFADRIMELQASHDLYSKLSKNSKVFSKQYDINKQAIEYFNFYKHIIQ